MKEVTYKTDTGKTLLGSLLKKYTINTDIWDTFGHCKTYNDFDGSSTHKDKGYVPPYYRKI